MIGVTECGATASISVPRAVSTELYWVMPTAQAFIDTVATACSLGRTVKIALPVIEIVGLHRAVEGALERVHLTAPARRWLKIEDGMDVATEVGAALGKAHVAPEELAVLTHGDVRVIILEAIGPVASRACEIYVERTTAALPPNEGSGMEVKTIALIEEGQDIRDVLPKRSGYEIRFSGALSQEEMSAYLAVRMANRPGPHTTGLLRRLVTEFAGFDAHLAEELISFSDMDLLSLPDSLHGLAAQAEERWRSGQWAALCYAEVAGKPIQHTLHEIHLSRHAGPERRSAQEALKRKYWRACVRSLLPYLEEHRALVIAPLRTALEAHAKRTGGKLVRTTFSGRRVETTSLDDVEYNQIPGLIFYEQFVAPPEAKARLAVRVCYAAKAVRDEIAHMRAPKPESIMELTSQLEAFLA